MKFLERRIDQVGVQPPTIILICNEPKAFTPQYRRYLLSVLRDNIDFGEVPIKMFLQKRRRDDGRDDLQSGEDTPEEAAAIAAEFGPDDAEGSEHDAVAFDDVEDEN